MNPDLVGSQPNAIAAAVSWLEQTLIGNLAAVVAIIAVACFGLMLMSGRVSTRSGAQLIFGCFILFGASSIAAGIMGVLGSSEPQGPPPAPVAAAPSVPVAQPPTSHLYDPYAGAALPPRR